MVIHCCGSPKYPDVSDLAKLAKLAILSYIADLSNMSELSAIRKSDTIPDTATLLRRLNNGVQSVIPQVGNKAAKRQRLGYLRTNDTALV